MAEAVIATSTPQADRHFNTDHLHADLKGRSIRGGAVTVAATGARFFLNTGATAILARMLGPADFGLIAMVTAFTGFVALFRDMGLSTATVQRADITQDQVSALFWINVVVSLILTGVGAAFGPILAWVNHEPRLVWVTIAVSSTFVCGGLTAQHAALLQRQMRFTTLAVIDIVAVVCSIAVAIFLAWAGASYWALVAMSGTQSLAVVFGVWFSVHWIPGRPRRFDGISSMMRFGGNLTGFNLLYYVTRNFDNFLIGSVLGSAQLGIYSKAYNILMMPIAQFSGPINAVAVPALSRLQNDPQRFRAYFLKANRILAFVGMPLVAFTFVEADNLVAILLGPKWSAVAPVFRWLAPAAFVGTLNSVPAWLCTALGRPEKQLRWALFSTPFVIAGFAIGLRWNCVGVAAGFSITWVCVFVLFIVYACSGSPVKFADLIGSVWRPVISAIFAALVVSLLPRLGTDLSHTIAKTMLSAAMFVVAFMLSVLLLPGGLMATRELLSIPPMISVSRRIPLYGRFAARRRQVESPRVDTDVGRRAPLTERKQL